MASGRRQALVRAAQFAVMVVAINLVIGAMFGSPPLARLLLNMLLVWSALMLLWIVQIHVIPRLLHKTRNHRDSDSPPSEHRDA